MFLQLGEGCWETALNSQPSSGMVLAEESKAMACPLLTAAVERLRTPSSDPLTLFGRASWASELPGGWLRRWLRPPAARLLTLPQALLSAPFPSVPLLSLPQALIQDHCLVKRQHTNSHLSQPPEEPANATVIPKPTFHQDLDGKRDSRAPRASARARLMHLMK